MARKTSSRTKASETQGTGFRTTREMAIACARIAEEKKASEITVLHVLPFLFLTDFFVVCTVLNRRQADAVSHEIAKGMKERGVRCLGRHGQDTGHWVALDFGSVVVHVFDSEARAHYDLDHLWAEAKRVAWKRRASRRGGGGGDSKATGTIASPADPADA